MSSEASSAGLWPLTIGIATVTGTSRDQKLGRLREVLGEHSGGDQGSESAERLAALLEADGHTVFSRITLEADRETLDAQLHAWSTHPAIDTVMVLGGIGLGPRDVTTEAMSQVVIREMVGFGETVRRLSAETQPLTALSLRAMAGVGKSAVFFALPDSPRAIDRLYPVLLGPLCDARQAGSLAALVPGLRAVD